MPNPGPLVIDFPPFRLDRRTGLLQRNGAPLSLRPKTFAVLLYLAERRGELVTKQELLDAVWAPVVVADDVVRVSIGELRAAFGDDRAAPRFIETVPRRGYRFIAKFGGSAASPDLTPPEIVESAGGDGPTVGRVRERREIAEWFRAATRGRRRVAFVSGEAGIGKTTLVETALAELRRTTEECQITSGQCIEHFGGGEPYLPVLGALTHLWNGPRAETVQATLAEHAPDWVLRALGPTASGPTEGAATSASTHEHTLHKLAASLEALAAETPLVLVLEDVHWSDYATLDLLSVLAQRREPARLLVLCTLRPAEAIVRGHPVASVKRELVRKGICHEILLQGLPASDVAAYLAARLDRADLPEEIVALFVDRTEGNPFFIVTLVDHLLERGLLVRRDERWEIRSSIDALRTAIPEGLRAVIEPRLDHLELDEIRVLEAASVAGPEFPAHAIAEIARRESDLGDVEYVEQLCDRLARRQDILREAGESTWPDGTASARYAFRHALYQQVAYQRIASSTCRRLHQAIGERLEAAYAGSTMDVASELAAHFERSHDVERAIRYRGEAAAHAGSRFASRETRFHLQAALDLLQTQPESAERLAREMPLLHQLGWTVATMNGWGDADAERAFTRMREIAERLEVAPMRLRAMESLRSLHEMRAEYGTTRTLCEETMALAAQLGDQMAAGSSHVDLAAALVHTGELERGHEHAERARALLEDDNIHAIATRVLLATTFAHRGRIARSGAMVDEALACAAKTGVPYFSAFAMTFAAGCFKDLRDVERARFFATEALRLSSERGFSEPRIKAAMLLGWCDVQEGRAEEGRAAVRAGFLEFMASGERTSTTSWQTLLAGAHLTCGDVAGANDVIDAGFAFLAETGERLCEPELHRLRGECLLAGAGPRAGKAAAAEQFEQAIAIAAARKASLFELRAATSLFRLRGKAARERVARLVEGFDAENDCADARIARALLGR
jgi:DNA-binding winged helix-turn-helix (wHTH) protein